MWWDGSIKILEVHEISMTSSESVIGSDFLKQQFDLFLASARMLRHGFMDDNHSPPVSGSLCRCTASVQTKTS